MNVCTFTGRLARDAEVRTTNNGKTVVQFRLASDVGYGDRKTTLWLQCQIWGRENLASMLTKGKAVTVYGELSQREYQDRNGATQTSLDLNVRDLEFQSGGKQDDGNGGGNARPQGYQQPQQQAPVQGNGQPWGQGAPAQGNGGQYQNAAPAWGRPVPAGNNNGIDRVPF